MDFSISRITDILHSAGITHFGVARVTRVEHEWQKSFSEWIAGGNAAGMDYLDRYHDVRAFPALLLPGARSIICVAVPYFHPSARRNPAIAPYALGSDYHEVLKKILQQAAAAISGPSGAETRVCVDTAPLRERYWAERCGVGRIGLNGHLIVPGAGSYFFLGEILTTAEIETTPPLPDNPCTRCGACVRACPTGALGADGKVDARKCLSYLTIEHRGEFPDGTRLHGCLYGCDICARACPLNASPEPAAIPEFIPRPEVLDLDARRAASLTQEEFSRIFSHSAVKRAKLAGLLRNARAILSENQSGHE